MRSTLFVAENVQAVPDTAQRVVERAPPRVDRAELTPENVRKVLDQERLRVFSRRPVKVGSGKVPARFAGAGHLMINGGATVGGLGVNIMRRGHLKRGLLAKGRLHDFRAPLLTSRALPLDYSTVAQRSGACNG